MKTKKKMIKTKVEEVAEVEDENVILFLKNQWIINNQYLLTIIHIF
jgi:hypothetical protein